jgi:ubiquinone/menaquinone biosynthesis C-methylase UbiE
MLDLAGIGSGHRVLDVAAGTGEQTLMAARRVGPHGFVLATDIADRMLAYLDEAARNEGLANVQTCVMDARLLTLESDSFDAAICRLALMLIPERDKALTGIQRALKSGRKFAAVVLPWFVVIAFDSAEKAKAWDRSPAQKEVNDLRRKSTKSRVFIADGELK